jgi:hypothetical protein
MDSKKEVIYLISEDFHNNMLNKYLDERLGSGGPIIDIGRIKEYERDVCMYVCMYVCIYLFIYLFMSEFD